MVAQGDSARSRSLADKLNYLFSTLEAEGRPSTLDEVVAGIRASGGSVSRGTLNHLRLGRTTNPSKATLEDIARFFQVPVSYLLDDPYAQVSTEDLEVLQVVRQAEIADLVRAIGHLRPATRRALEQVVADLRAMQASGPTERTDRP
ncbi:helix-turn-helix transcriptional regulator [Pseudonocardia sp. EV170527-09]|uniref:helix-turn-helix domain-containing protein n=1 Tax=Pseudonocardia sp. EV170527-09 TaxID=2603411 RepID=UPI0011F31FCA|nr:helix-turn-helix domain-containing protein [Pseudonocardia sp. EV170527-09]KAA1012199.1 helix-turn-helix transcriptional regulator [Pseudonocardia sp. EV170527-09]